MTRTMNEQSLGITGLFMGWYFGLVSYISFHWIPATLSSIASLMAIINYFYQIRKNRTK